MTDGEHLLVARAKQDPRAFGALYEENVNRIYNYIYQRTGSAADAQDLTTRTFVKALMHLHRYEFRGLPFSAWLYRIAHNAVANWHRDRGRHRMVTLDTAAGHGAERNRPEDVAQANEQKDRLLEAVRRLPSDRQQLLILKFSEGMSNAEIGEVMGRTEGAVKSLYHRTLLALRRNMGGAG
jgi:RNA polymerase sigma-70 factor (ECF subfamily)